VTQYKNCPFRVNSTIGLNNKTTAPHSKSVSPDIFQLTNVPVLSDAVVTFLSSIVVLTTKWAIFFLIVPPLHKVGDVIGGAWKG